MEIKQPSLLRIHLRKHTRLARDFGTVGTHAAAKQRIHAAATLLLMQN